MQKTNNIQEKKSIELEFKRKKRLNNLTLKRIKPFFFVFN